MRKLVVEAIGTFFLVLTIALAALGGGAGALAPLAIGAVLMVMVYAGGHISGAHYNPAVSVAVLVRRAMTARELGGYAAAQVIGATLAVIIARVLLPRVADVADIEPDMLAMSIAEFVFTFALAWVVLNVATAEGTKGNSYFGLAIGFTVTAGAYAVGSISGGAFNPAVAIALMFMGALDVGTALLMILVQLGAGAAAAAVFDRLVLDVDKPTTSTRGEQAGLRPAAEPER
ncbi:MAG TPA: aquaporin [Longimicrobiales bacterium]